MYKVTLSISYIDVDFIFDDLQKAAYFIDDMLSRVDRDSLEDRKMTVSIALVEQDEKENKEESKEESEVENNESVSD